MSFTPLPQQLRAIEAPMGPVLVVAGPGAGKTYCLIARIQHLIASGIDPRCICAVTFTNRAAEEIALRLGERAEQITRGTIHAFCLAVLREFVEDAGLRRGFGVADEPYQKVILGRLNVPLDRRGQLLTLFSRHRFQGYRLTDGDARLFREYVSWLRARNMVDFDELITKAEPLADRVADRWDYVLVDEFQDVNAVQYDLLKKLVEPHGNFFAVGDDEQSIFAWTGADPYVLERFHRDYDVAPIILDKNRRCSRQIFESAARAGAESAALSEAADGGSGVAARSSGPRLPRRARGSHVAAARSPGRPCGRGPLLGRLCDSLPQAPAGRAHRGPVAACGNPVSPRARPLADRGRGDRVRDRRAARRAEPRRSGGDAHVREVRAVGALPARGRSRAQ